MITVDVEKILSALRWRHLGWVIVAGILWAVSTVFVDVMAHHLFAFPRRS